MERAVIGTPPLGLGAVVIGRNEGERLVRCLTSLSAIRHVVYVDSGSTDGSTQMARDLGVEVVDLDLSIPFTAARARNAGFRRLTEICPDLEFVQFIDGDCEVIDGWIAGGMAFLAANPGVAVVCGQRMERFPEASIYNAMCHREWNTPVGEALACGGDAIFRAGALVAAGGYNDELVAGEEPELCGRLRQAGHRIWRIDLPMTLHDAAIFRLGQYMTRNRRAGFGITQVLSVSGRDIDPTARQMQRRAIIWGMAIPAALLLLAVACWPAAVVAAMVYPAQVLRHALRDTQGIGGGFGRRVQVATLAMLGKFAEARGVLEFVIKNALGLRKNAILYK